MRLSCLALGSGPPLTIRARERPSSEEEASAGTRQRCQQQSSTQARERGRLLGQGRQLFEQVSLPVVDYRP